MKKKILKVTIIAILSILVIPFSCFEAFVFLNGGISLSLPGFCLVHEQNHESRYYSNDHIVNYLTEEDIPSYVFDYLVGLEDQNFYKHKGYDLKRIIKSTFDNIKSKDIVSGGSTITQQLARLLYLSNEKSYQRKITELYYSRRLENGLSKNEILTLYLNLAYFGENIYGYDAACRSYFGCTSNEASKSMTVLLLSLLPSPNNYSPRINKDLSLTAYNKAIDNLYYRNVIDSTEAHELYISYPSVIEDNIIDNQDTYYYQAINQYLTDKRINTKLSNIEVDTYLDRDLQKKTSEYIKEVVTEHNAQAGVVIMEPSSGNVKVLIGGKDDYSFNRATDTNKDIGSTCKPILYLTALENGFDPLNTFESSPTTLYLSGGKSFTPHNANNKYANRKITMVEALSTSDNIYACKLALVLGTKAMSNKLKLVDETIDNNITNALGSFSLSLLKLTSIYNAIANEGYYNYPKFFSNLKVNGNKRLVKEEGFKLFEKDKANIMSYLLTSTYDPSFYTYASPTMLYYPLSKRFAVKTGTTDSAAFVVGYTPQVTIGVYVGKDDNETLVDSGAAKRLFKKVAEQATLHDDNNFFSTDGLNPFRLHNINLNKSSFIYYR